MKKAPAEDMTKRPTAARRIGMSASSIKVGGSAVFSLMLPSITVLPGTDAVIPAPIFHN